MMNQQMCMQPIDSKLRQLLAQQHESHFFDATLNAPLLANHALSDWRQTKNLTIKQLAADVNALIMYLKLDKVILIGHSMGASVIWAYQSQYGETHIAIIITIDESPKLTNDSE
ncbi:alpha/beta hydrolase [Weissella confusa]|uniref:Alpha/beta hydrolase n=1 Tax=Weissella confusa TaxID=1583 RepID=A0A923NIL1_WEICO|nr:alpha/beta hydrolase [Weissella confusa]